MWKDVNFVDKKTGPQEKKKKDWSQCQLPAPSWLWPLAIGLVMFQMDCKKGLILSHKVVMRIKYNYISEHILWRLKHYVRDFPDGPVVKTP